LTTFTDSVAPRQLFFHTRVPLATSAAKVPSKQRHRHRLREYTR
jgi:hypothetical protein